MDNSCYNLLRSDIIKVWLKLLDAVHVQRPWEEDCQTTTSDCLDRSHSPERPWGGMGRYMKLSAVVLEYEVISWLMELMNSVGTA